MNLKITTLVATLVAALIFTPGEFMSLISPQFTPSFDGSDSNTVLTGQPDCGWYNIHGYKLGNSLNMADVSTNLAWDREDSITTDLIEININEFSNRDIDSNALSQLDSILSQYRYARHSVILRVMYDWNGRADLTEPETLDQVYSHIDSLAPVINKYKDIVFVFQGMLLGNHAEMHGSYLLTDSSMKKLAQKLSASLDPSIYLAVRTPAQRRFITGSKNSIALSDAYNGSLSSRLGLFNDGMFGSDIDLGTYGDTTMNGQKDLHAKGTRSEEISYQNSLARFVPNGGESGGYSSYGELDNAMTEMRQMHISYLSHDFSEQTISRWKRSSYTIPGTDITVNGMNAIGLYMGYRPLVSSVEVSRDGFLLRDVSIDVTVQNRGFAPVYRDTDAALTLTASDGSVITLRTSLDRKSFAYDGEAILHFYTRSKNLNSGVYTASLSLTNSAANRPVILANNGYSDNSLTLGSLEKQ